MSTQVTLYSQNARSIKVKPYIQYTMSTQVTLYSQNTRLINVKQFNFLNFSRTVHVSPEQIWIEVQQLVNKTNTRIQVLPSLDYHIVVLVPIVWTTVGVTTMFSVNATNRIKTIRTVWRKEPRLQILKTSMRSMPRCLLKISAHS